MPQPKITQQQFRTTFNLTTHHLCFPIEYGIITDLESVERGKRPQDLILGDSRGYDDVEGSATCEEPSEQDEPHRNWPLVELQLLARPPDPAPLDGHLPLRFWVLGGQHRLRQNKLANGSKGGFEPPKLLDNHQGKIGRWTLLEGVFCSRPLKNDGFAEAH